jgi:Fe2+ or Zn2+ uptake regulation protein
MTKQRALILEIVRSDKCHHTAEEIFEIAKASLEGISRATVYNNLHTLERDKLIRRITGEDGSDRYDNSYIPHGHLFCTECKCVTDFNLPMLDATLCDVAGCEIDSYELKVRYICPSCRGLADN